MSIRSLARLAAFTAALALAPAARADVTLLNVSYDPTRELYKAINSAFGEVWRQSAGEKVTIRASHGGSGAQARAVIDGLKADMRLCQSHRSQRRILWIYILPRY